VAVDFADLEQCALRLLRMTRWRLNGAPRLAHVFVDEYQDINDAQDPFSPRSVVMGGRKPLHVGDVKQSIYRFRLANPKIFTRYATRWAAAGADGRRIALTENFRSARPCWISSTRCSPR